MDLEAFRWLLTEEGQGLLAAATRVYAEAERDPIAAAAALRRESAADAGGEPGASRAAVALTQAGLRVRAAAKFGADAGRMYFTQDGLEQATRPRVAAHRAARLAAAAPASVVDLTCGVGADLVAFARAGLTTAGVDLDPVAVAVAGANLAALGLGGAVREADARTLDVGAFGAAYADPARRGVRGRVFDADGWAPPWTYVAGLLTSGHPLSVVKVAPGIPHALVPDGVEAEWVSDAGQVVEAALWSRVLAVAERRATVLRPGGLATLSDADDPYDGRERPVRPVGPFLFEPDGAVIRAGLVTAVAALVDGGLLDAHVAYLTADHAHATPFARGYRVLEQLPYREKALRAALRERGVGRLTIKKRGVNVVPDRLRTRLALRGDAEATLVLSRVAGHGVALLVDPL